jgi:peptide-methionine (S)-S-oxide reductase
MKPVFLIFIFLFQTCISQNTPIDNINPVWIPQDKFSSDLEKAYFASGCFWCVEAIYESINGVKEVYSGYAGGITKNPTYNQIGTGLTNHAEAVEVLYNPNIINFETLVEVFFGSHDPTTKNSQGPDYGTQYRSIVFYNSEKQKKIIEKYMSILRSMNTLSKKITTEVKVLKKFYYAEEYHQDYKKRNPNNSYIQKISIPRLNNFKEKFTELLKK